MSSYTSYPQHAAQVITVTNTSELNAALDTLGTSGGGTILLDGNGGPFKIIDKDIGDANNPILIGAADTNNPPVVTEIYLQNASHIAMTDLHIDSSSLSNPLPYHDVRIYGSDHIDFVGNHMSSIADGFLGGDPNAVKGGAASLIRDSQDINFSDNFIENYKGGAGFLEVNGLTFDNNEMVGIQHDGFQAGGLQNATINNNYMHDFHGSTQSENHSDFIMIWGTNAKSVTSNIQIAGNVLDTNGGGAYQGIFIGNNQFGGSGPSGQYFQGIEIFDNLVHTSMYHGITVGDAQGVSIYDNTVLFDPESWTQGSGNSPLTQAEPWIMTSNAPNASVTGNVAGHVSIWGNGTGAGTNFIIDYNDPNSPNYVENHIANLQGTDGLGLSDLSFLPSSSIYGNYGATISSSASASDPVTAVMRLDEVEGFRGAFQLNADLSMFGGQMTNPSNATYEWLMDDGTYVNGTGGYHVFQTPGAHEVTLKVTDGSGNVDFITRTIDVLDQTNFSINFDNGATDTSGASSSISVKDPTGSAFVGGLNGSGFRLDGTNSITVNKSNEQIFDLDTFEINLDFKLDSVGSAGRLMGIHTSWDIQVLSNGGLLLNLPTDDGSYKIYSSANVLDDTNWHDISIQYDGPAGTVNIIVDGNVVGSGNATGTTFSQSHHGLVLGPTWGASVKGVVDNFEMTSPPSTTVANLTSTGTFTGGAGWTLPTNGSGTGGSTIDTSTGGSTSNTTDPVDTTGGSSGGTTGGNVDTSTGGGSGSTSGGSTGGSAGGEGSTDGTSGSTGGEGSTEGTGGSTGATAGGPNPGEEGSNDGSIGGDSESDGNNAEVIHDFDGPNIDQSDEDGDLGDNNSLVSGGSHAGLENQNPSDEGPTDMPQTENIAEDLKTQPSNPTVENEFAPSINGISQREFVEKLTDWIKTKFGNSGNEAVSHETVPELSSIFHSIHAGHFGSIGKQTPGEFEEEVHTDQI